LGNHYFCAENFYTFADLFKEGKGIVPETFFSPEFVIKMPM